MNKRPIIKALFAITFFASVSYCAIAQDVKVKKREITVDDRPAGTMESGRIPNQEYSNWTYYDTSGKEVFKAFFHELNKYRWYTVKLPDYDKAADVPLEALSFTLNYAKSNAELFIKKYRFFHDGAWDKAIIRQYIDEHAANTGAIAREDRTTGAASNPMQIDVDSLGNITTRGYPLGYIIEKPANSAQPEEIQIFNAHQQLKTTGYYSKPLKEYGFVLPNARRLDYNAGGLRRNGGKDFRMQVLLDMQDAGAWSPADAVMPANLLAAPGQESPINIRNKQGTVMLKDGTSLSGILTFELVKKDPLTKKYLDVGEAVTLAAPDAKGRTRNENYSTRTVKSFEADGRHFDDVKVFVLLSNEEHFAELVYHVGKASLYKLCTREEECGYVYKVDDVEVAVPLATLIKQGKKARKILESCAELEKFVMASQNSLSDNEADGRNLVDAYCK